MWPRLQCASHHTCGRREERGAVRRADITAQTHLGADCAGHPGTALPLPPRLSIFCAPDSRSAITYGRPWNSTAVSAPANSSFRGSITPHATAVYASCLASPPPHATLASRRLARPYLGRTHMRRPVSRAEIWRPWRTRQCGIEDTAAPSPGWRRWSSPEAVLAMRAKGIGYRKIAREVGLGVETVMRLTASRDISRPSRPQASPLHNG